jgi:hypothetical protein
MAGMGSLCDSLGGLTTIIHQCYNPPMQTIQKARLRSGQFAPGQSGNPGGRPKDEHRVAELARSYTAEAIDTLVELMRDGKDERVRGTAAQALLDRGWGKAKVEVVTGAEGSYLDVPRAVNKSMLAKRNETQT